jgi:hypothetical protein
LIQACPYGASALDNKCPTHLAISITLSSERRSSEESCRGPDFSSGTHFLRDMSVSTGTGRSPTPVPERGRRPAPSAIRRDLTPVVTHVGK